MEDATIVCDKVVERVSSHHVSPGSTTRESQIRAVKQVPIRRYVTVSQEAKLFNCHNVNPRRKGNGGRRRMCVLFFGGLGVCYVLASGWQKPAAKYCLHCVCL